jgi:hypothetical protein
MLPTLHVIRVHLEHTSRGMQIPTNVIYVRQGGITTHMDR